MKISLFFIVSFLINLSVLAQTDGWYLLSKPSEISKIVPDDVNADELHVATDIGYVKLNTTTNEVTDYLNLTSQSPAIGNVKDIALDPNSDDIALALKDGFAIFSGGNVSIYNYTNSDLTIGENTFQFYYLQVEFAKDGSLYIFKEDVFGYQKFSNGVFEAETATSFQPQDIAENNAGTKVYFAGANNGLWELDKGTSTWTNYTASNSNLFQNFLTSLCFDPNDNLYIGHYQGLNKLEPNGTITSCNSSSPIPVFEINVSPTTGELLVRNSKPNTASISGLSIVDYNTCEWTNYKEDGTNCLDNNVYTALSCDSNGEIYACPQDFVDSGKIINFKPVSDNCTELNINYTNAPATINSNTVADIAIRKNGSGNVDIGITRGRFFNIFEILVSNFDGFISFFSPPLELSPGNFLNSVNRDNDYFIVEDNGGWTFVDGNNNITSYAHNISGYIANNTLKASAFDSDDGIVNLIYRGFDPSFNYRVYKTQCETATGTCSPSEEIFTNNRDLSEIIAIAATEDLTTNEVVCVAVKTDASGDLKRTKETWSKTTNDEAVPVWDEAHPIHYFVSDFIVLANAAMAVIDELSVYPKDANTIETRTGNSNNSNPTVETTTFDVNIDSTPDKIESLYRAAFTQKSPGDEIAGALVSFVKGGWTGIGYYTMQRSTAEATGNKISETKAVSSSGEILIDNLPNDISVQKFEIFQYNSTEAVMVLLTNYGLLVKTGIDISTFTLSDKQPLIIDNDIKLTPNPSNNFVSFTSNLIIKIQVYDINGRNVLNSDGNSISVKTLSKGIYIVKGKTSENISISKKLIKI